MVLSPASGAWHRRGYEVVATERSWQPCPHCRGEDSVFEFDELALDQCSEEHLGIGTGLFGRDPIGRNQRVDQLLDTRT